jgi:hypothetical protein
MTIDFLDQNGRSWGDPDVVTDASTVERVAAGEAELADLVAWIRQRRARSCAARGQRR